MITFLGRTEMGFELDTDQRVDVARLADELRQATGRATLGLRVRKTTPLRIIVRDEAITEAEVHAVLAQHSGEPLPPLPPPPKTRREELLEKSVWTPAEMQEAVRLALR